VHQEVPEGSVITQADKPTVVLLVEDEALVRMVGADILMDSGFRVVEAVNADEALTLLEARPDVRAIITDVEMPGSLNGFTFARVVHRAWPRIGLVIMSGREGPGDEDLPPGVHFISKPFTAAELLDAVHAVLRSKHAPIVIPLQEAPTAASGAPVLPAAVSLDQLPADNGLTGGLAQPLPEPPDE
jgi:two-component system, response regulator PdtaR